MKIIVKVIVNAKITKVVEDTTDLLGSRFLKIKVNKPPEDGKANKEVIKAISEYLKVKERNITIIKGKTSSNKLVEILQKSK